MRVQQRTRQPGALLQSAVPVFVSVHVVPQDGRASVLNRIDGEAAMAYQRGRRPGENKMGNKPLEGKYQDS